MRTDVEILTKLETVKDRDMFGTIAGDLVSCLGREAVKPFLNPEVRPEDWNPEARDHDSVVARIEDYMPFAWGKANDERGLSAMRSLEHMYAWLWLLGGEHAQWAEDNLNEYDDYGKPHLASICTRFGWDFSEWAKL